MGTNRNCALNEISLTREATARLRSIQFNTTETVKSWGSESESRYSSNNSLKIGKFHWQDLSVWESEHSGHTTDGKFGLNLFEGKIVELNFEDGYMVIHSALPKIKETYDPVKIISENGLLFMEGDCKVAENVYSNRLLIHTGYSGAILLDDVFVETNKIGEQLKVISESTLKDSYGNELKTINAMLPYFQLGKTEFSEVPIGFFKGSINRQKISVLGGDLLKRFNIIFDLEDSTIYLRPNELSGVPYTSSN